jgi:hypothetical protein
LTDKWVTDRMRLERQRVAYLAAAAEEEAQAKHDARAAAAAARRVVKLADLREKAAAAWSLVPADEGQSINAYLNNLPSCKLRAICRHIHFRLHSKDDTEQLNFTNTTPRDVRQTNTLQLALNNLQSLPEAERPVRNGVTKLWTLPGIA